MRSTLIAIAALLASCGTSPNNSGGDGSGGDSGPCSVGATGVDVSGGTFSVSSNMISCTGTVNGTAENCGTGAATVTHTACSDGHGFTITGGTATLYMHLAGGASASTWTAGAEFEGGLPLTGNITVFGIGAPSQLQPPAGTTEGVSFVLQGTTGGQGIVANGVLQAAW